MRIRPIAPNQTELTIDGIGRIFFSYQTPVAAWIDSEATYYKTSKKWSVTTSKHINKWLGGAYAEVQPQEWFDSLLEQCKCSF